MAFTRICRIDELGAGEALRIDQGEEPIALFNVDGEFHAIQDTCSHEEWSLAEGYLEGDVVVCALHMAKFCVRTGKVCAPPATEAVKVFPVRVEGNEVFVDLAAGAIVP